MASHNFIAPSTLDKSSFYEAWKKELAIWQSFTDIKKEKQGSALFLTLEGKAKEAALELDLDKFNCENGVDNIIKKLDTLYLRDKVQTAYEAYDRLEKFQRKPEMSMTDFIIEFERLLSKTRSYGTEMSEDILAYRLLKSANISEHHQELARATVPKLTYDAMKSQLKKIFGDAGKADLEDNVNVKVESTYESHLQYDALYGDSYGYRRRGAMRSRPAPQRGGMRGGRGAPNIRRSGRTSGMRGGAMRGRNPLDEYGNPTKCSVCASINHWAAACPDGQYFTEDFEVEEYEADHEVTLFQSNLITEDCLKIFVAESIGSAILDSGASSTVSGKNWMDIYLGTLPKEKLQRVQYFDSNNSFKFGAGDIHKSLYKVKVPATIGQKEIFVESDVVDLNIPMLFSKSSMKKANTEINFTDDTVKMLGQVQKISLTSSGHYAVSLNPKTQILDDVCEKRASITLNVQHNPEDKRKTAFKLHSQFSHPQPNKLIDLINRAGLGNDTELLKYVKDISRSCKVCKEYQRPGSLPVVGLPMATEFNEVVAMDIKFLNGKMILHLIDHLTRFSAAAILSSKKPNEIVDKIFKIWICVFGPPIKFLSDNGGEFNNETLREMSERYNITVKTTAAEAPWSNGLCERHNAVLAETMLKTMADSNCSPEVALSWAVHSKNSLSNVHGFSPYQLAIGYNPKLPSVLSNRPPAMESNAECLSDAVSQHLWAMGAARKAFIESESSEKLKRALRHNLRTKNNAKFFTGDSVYYKRMDCKKWKGPGKVIGHDSQQVLIKHGGTYVRVHPCRVVLEKACEDNMNQEMDTDEGSQSPTHQQEYSDSGESSTPFVTAEDDSPQSSRAENDHEDTEDSDSNSEESQGATTSQVLEDGDVSREESQGATSQILQEKPSTLKLKRNSNIVYRTVDDENWKKCKVLSRTGKATGIYKHFWKVLKEGESLPCEIDFEKDVAEWKFENIQQEVKSLGESNSGFVQDAVIEETRQNEVYISHVNQEVMNAKMLELNNWIKENVYEAVPDEGQEAISVRWVVTPRLVDGKMITEARLVARGFEEDSSALRTDSPTCMKDSLRLIFSLSVSRGWSLNSIDIKAAFLQGNAIDREVFLKPPKEANQPNHLWLLKKVVYGLSDASRVWYLRVVDELKKLGAIPSKYDKAVFIWKKQGVLHGVLASHVDDFLWVGSEEFSCSVIQPLRSVFKVSKESKDCFKYVGIHVKKLGDMIEVSQKPYIDSLSFVEVPDYYHNEKGAELDRSGRRTFRGVVGQISWAANISRPDMSYSSCELSTAQSKPTVADLLKANKCLKEIKADDVSVKYAPLKIEDAKLVVFSDASYGNLRDGGSQGGSIVFLTDGNAAAPISWSSHRIKRVARSTLCAETLAAVEALDSAYMISKLGGELFDRDALQIELYTDNKSLFDAINTTNMMLDRRMRVDIAALREMSENNEVSFFWLETKWQLADVLTKKGASKLKLIEALKSSVLHLE